MSEYKPKNVICQNCKVEFIIEPDDFGFYEKIKVPPPTFCPECRIIRRFTWRNERSLYKKKDNSSEIGEEIISMYSPDSPYKIYNKEYWWSDKWDPLEYGFEYDFSKPFFKQFDKLLKEIPLSYLQNMNSVDSRYCNYIESDKNCYLVFGTGFSENSRYLNRSSFSKDSQDLLTSTQNETIAQEYFPLTKEETLKQGYKWKDKEERNYVIDIKNKDIPDDIKDVNDDIINKIIECKHKDCNHQCTEAFKIIPEELQFYRRMNLPLPHLCPKCRHYERLSQRNPLKLWHRKCMHEGCNNEFETSYAPYRPEIIYCEKCYQNEVY